MKNLKQKTNSKIVGVDAICDQTSKVHLKIFGDTPHVQISNFRLLTSKRGITLIALIVTIIVMLILVSVSISIALNTGLFSKAGEATGKIDDAKTSEQGLANGGVTIGGQAYNSIDEYLNSIGQSNKVINIHEGEAPFQTWNIGATVEEDATASLYYGENEGKFDLVIAGTGETKDLYSETVINCGMIEGTGYAYQDYDIENVYVTEGITCIGKALLCYTPPPNCGYRDSNVVTGESTVKNIYIASTVTEIKEQGIYGCASAKLHIYGNLSNIGIEAFNGSGNNDVLDLSNCSFETVSTGAFACSLIKKIILPPTVTSIDELAFAGSYLEEIILPEGLTSIGDAAFDFCTKINTVIIPNTVETIGPFAFQFSSIKEIVLPEGLEVIERHLFYRSDLESLEIPRSVLIIRNQAFHDCNSLSSITIPDTVLTIEENAFSGWEQTQTINVQTHLSKPDGWNMYWDYYDSTRIPRKAQLNWGQ